MAPVGRLSPELMQVSLMDQARIPNLDNLADYSVKW